MCLLPALLVLSVLIVEEVVKRLKQLAVQLHFLGLQSNALVMLFWESFRREKGVNFILPF